MAFGMDWGVSPGRAFLETEFRDPLYKNLVGELGNLSRGNIVTVRSIEYRVGKSMEELVCLLERTTPRGEGIGNEDEWRPVATMTDVAYFINDLVGGTPLWLKSFTG